MRANHMTPDLTYLVAFEQLQEDILQQCFLRISTTWSVSNMLLAFHVSHIKDSRCVSRGYIAQCLISFTNHMINTVD